MNNSRDAFVALLNRLILDGTIDPAQAAALLEQFDAGEIPPLVWPLTPEEQERGLDERIILAALLALALLLGYQSADVVVARNLPAQARALGRAGQIALAEQVQDAFERDVTRLTERLLSREIPLPIWQRQMGDAIRRHAIGQSALGRGSLGMGQYGRLIDLLHEEMAYLSRFADQIALASAGGTAWSLERIRQRAISYAGVGRGEFWRGLEAAEMDESDDDLAGWVVDYIANDDNRTCGPCLDAEQAGPYLPEVGPYPGQVCLGGAACRCWRELRYDPAAYALLMGAAV